MISFWQKLNFLLPDPQCRTKGDAITVWDDVRPQPTDAAVLAVPDATVQAVLDDAKNDRLDADVDDVLLVIAKAFHNHENRIRALESLPPVTLRQVIASLKTL